MLSKTILVRIMTEDLMKTIRLASIKTNPSEQEQNRLAAKGYHLVV